MAKKKEKKTGGFFTSKKMTRQEWKQASLKRNQAAILNSKTPFIIKEAYKIARTNIIFSVSGSGTEECKIIAMTSACPGEGKTTSCLNLALTFAQTGARVLLIDGDLRKPRIHQYLGVIKTNGLSTVLSNQKTFDEVVYHDVKYGLDCLTAGSIPPNPAELLASDAMQALLENLKYRYDYIFIDTPPVTVVTDATALSKYLSGLIVVVRDGYTEHDSIDHAINLLRIADAKILGFFLNDVDPATANYGNYNKAYGRRYGYKYGFRYGFKYGSRSGKYSYLDGSYGFAYSDGYSYSDGLEERDEIENIAKTVKSDEEADGFNKVKNAADVSDDNSEKE
ncbi:MAG: CpsD/CapB family tyrosine-protein kinase [Clostridiales bacterium]|nr:CpsD/CapB family tyrosine-protein kinase [Clostridiales bacterium]